MQRLILRFGSSIELPVHWLVYSEQAQEIIASGELSSALDLSMLKDHADNSEVIALAPSTDILLTEVELPVNAARKALNAIPFMLEEDICTDVSNHFFALGQRSDTRQAVAVVEKAKLEMWQQILKDADIFCQIMVPDVLALPYVDSTVSAIQLGDTLITRTTAFSGLSGESDWLFPLVAKEVAEKSYKLNTYTEIDGADELSQEQIQTNFDELPLLLMLKHVDKTSLNLFQGQYAVKREGNPHWQKWKVAAILAVVALSVNIVAKTVELNQIQSQRDTISAQIRTSIEQGFPDIGQFRQARQAVEREIARLEQTGGSVSMLAILSQLTDAFATTGVTPQTLRFDASRTELRMQSVADNFESLERFRRDVQSLGFAVDQGAINNQGDQVVGVIVVKG